MVLCSRCGIRRAGVLDSALNNGAKDFAGGVVDERMPEIARDRFFSLAAFASNGVLHRERQAMRGLVKQDFESIGALIARIGAGNGDVQRVERGVSSRGIGEGANFNANFFFGPFGLVNLSQAF